MTDPIRVVIVDDHPVVRDGTAALLARQPGLTIAGTAGSIAEARELLGRTEADIVLLDIRLGEESGLAMLAEDGGEPARPTPAVLVLTAYDYPQYAEAALRLGAAGFVVKTAPLAELVGAIERVASGGLAFAARPSPGDRIRLSPREHEVVRLVAEGLSNDEVGLRLGIGAKTVEAHLARVYERYGVGSRTELATRALRDGWLDIPPG